MESDQQDRNLWSFLETHARDTFDHARARLDHILRIIRDNVTNGVVLDIGFGNAYLLKNLCSRQIACHGIDISPDNIQITERMIQEHGMNIIVREAAATALPYPDDFFDVVVASEILEHLEWNDIVRSVSEIRRCMKPGGMLIATVPAEENLQEHMCFCPRCSTLFHRWGHKTAFTKKDIEKMIDGSGLCLKQVYRRLFKGASLSLSGKILNLFKSIKCTVGLQTSYSRFVVIAKKERGRS